MRWMMLMILMAMAFRSSAAPEEGFRVVTHASNALGREASYYAYVPVDAVEGEVFPVLLILHGAWGNYADWYNNTALRDLVKQHRMILVLPDGGEFGWYLDSPLMPESQYESYVMKDLLSDVAARFPVHPTARGIMGLSMGGHGAMILATRNPGVFGSVSSLSGILKLTNHGGKWELDQRLGTIEEHPGRWEAHSVWDQAAVFKGTATRILFDCGVEDTGTGAIRDNRLLHERFMGLGIPHTWREHAGTHTWDYWGDHLNEHLVFHQAAMIDETPGLSKWQRHWYERVRVFHDGNAQATLNPLPRPVLVLLGPSTMEALKAEFFPDFQVVNRGIIAEGVGVAGRGTAWRLEESVFDVRPDVVVYSDATNDLGDLARNGGPALEAIAGRHELNVAAIRQRLPGTRVVLLTCGPARDRYAIINEHVVAFNALLPAIAERQGCLLLNTHELLVGGDGLLRADFTGDGLHLNEAGTAVFVARINEGLRATMTK